MNGAVIPFSKPEHQRTLESLPWFLTGTLAADEQAAVQMHLQVCPTCRAELASERALKAACEVTADGPAYEDAFARLMPRLDEAQASHREAKDRRAGFMPAWFGRLAANLAGHGPVGALAAMALVAQVGILVLLGWNLQRSEPQAASFHALSARPPSVRGDLVVVFGPATPQSRIQSILLARGARIVDGPLDSGAYVLSVPDGEAPRVLAALRGEREVRLAAALDSGMAR